MEYIPKNRAVLKSILEDHLMGQAIGDSSYAPKALREIAEAQRTLGFVIEYDFSYSPSSL